MICLLDKMQKFGRLDEATASFWDPRELAGGDDLRPDLFTDSKALLSMDKNTMDCTLACQGARARHNHEQLMIQGCAVFPAEHLLDLQTRLGYAHAHCALLKGLNILLLPLCAAFRLQMPLN